MDPEEWFERLLEEYRAQVGDLSPNVTEHISNLDNLDAPCQITDFWIRDPDRHFVFITHSPAVQDGRIKVHGPLAFKDVLEAFEAELEDDLWETPLTQEELQFRVIHPSKERTYRPIFEILLVNLYETIKNTSVQAPPSTGLARKQAFLRNSSVWQYYGDITQADPIEVVEDIVRASVTSHEQSVQNDSNRNRGQGGGSKDESDEGRASSRDNEWDGFGTYLFPPITVGKEPRVQLREKISDHRHMEYWPKHQIIRTTIASEGVEFYHNGFVAVDTPHKSKAKTILNLVSFALISHKKQAYIVREQELGSFRKRDTPTPDGSVFGSSQMPMVARVVAQDRLWPSQWISEKRTLEAAELADIFFQSGFEEEIEIYLEAFTHYHQNEYTQAFFFAWLLIEREIDDNWREYVSREKMSNSRKGKLLNPGIWTTDSKLEALNLAGEFSHEMYGSISALKSMRNSIHHGSRAAKSHEAEKALSRASRFLSAKTPGTPSVTFEREDKK